MFAALFRKFPNYAVINQVQSGADSNYNSLQAMFAHDRLARINNPTQLHLVPQSRLRDRPDSLHTAEQHRPKGEDGNSDLDTRNTFIAYVIYDVPGSSHGPQQLSHGWQLNSGLNFHGRPALHRHSLHQRQW